MWNASYTQTGAVLTATNAAHNGSFAPGGSATLGFEGTPGGGGGPGVSCTAA
nr:cellulose binding domain-containing protein [Streptomyces sp. 11x1]